MKKRLLSALLAVLMLTSAFTLVMPVAATEPAELTEEDYNSLYVQKGLIFAIDFFRNNTYWYGPAGASQSLADYTWSKTSAAISTEKTYNVSAGYLNLNQLDQATAIKGTDSLMTDPKGMTYEIIGSFSSKTANEVLVAGGVSFSAKENEGVDGIFFDQVRLECEVVHPVIRVGSASGPVLSFAYDDAFSGINTVVISMQSDGIKETTNLVPELADTLYFPPEKNSASGMRFYVTAEEYEHEGVTGVKMLENQSQWRRFSNCAPITVTTNKVWDEAAGAFVEGEEKTYVVGYTERSNTNEGITSAYPFYAPGTLAFYSNGDAVLPSTEVYFPTNTYYYGSTYLRKWSNPGVSMYAARVYNRVLGEDERNQNHLADLAKYFRLDIGNYKRLTEKDAYAVAALFKNYDYTADRDTLNTLLTTESDKILYDRLLEGLEAGSTAYQQVATFLVTAKEYALDVAGIHMLPAQYRSVVYAAVNAYAGSKSTDTLNALITASITAILQQNYGEYMSQSEYDYRDLYVRRDDLEFAVDFFSAKASDGVVYNGNSYDTWQAEYDNANKNWKTMTDADGNPFATKNDALKYVFANRVVTEHEEEWAAVAEKYVWKGDPTKLSALDISSWSYVQSNVRTFGDGKLITGNNNSLKLEYTDLDDDLTYQVVAKPSGSPEWQFGPFRLEMSASGTTNNLNTLRYYSFGVSGTAEAPVLNENFLYYAKLGGIAVPALYSSDITVSLERTKGDVDHYFHYEYDASKKNPQTQNNFFVTEVPAGSPEANAGPYSYYGSMSLKIFGNGNTVASYESLPYTSQIFNALGNWGGYEFYAIRIYSSPLTAEEIAQNHFADLAGLYGLDLTQYFTLDAADRAALHEMLLNVQLGTSEIEAVDAFEEAMAKVCYSFVPETEEGETFLTIAKSNFLNTASMRALSPWAQETIISAFVQNPAYVEESWYPAILQCELETLVKATLRDHYGESMIHKITEFLGYQLKKNGDPGMRGVFAFDTEMVDDILSKIDGAELTLGVMLLPAANADATVSVENGAVKLPDSAIASAVAYENGDYTEALFRLDGKDVVACEYFPEEYDEGVVYVAYAVITADGAEPILYQTLTNPSYAGENGLSLYELSRYANAKLGMAYEAIQTLLNDKTGDDKVVLTVGGANICDYAIVKNSANANEVDALQALIGSMVGIRLREVRADDAKNCAYVVRLGKDCDVVYTDTALYGLTLGQTTLNLFYSESGNSDAALAILADYLNLAYDGDGAATILVGTEIVRRAN